MKPLKAIGAALWVASSLMEAGAACHLLTTEHADLRVVYTPGPSNQFGLVLFNHTLEAGLATNQVTVVGATNAQLRLPAGTPFGQAGNPIWILPQNQNTRLPYLGTSGVGVPLGILANNAMAIQLTRVEGPGHFMMWQTLGPGQFDIQMDSRDGLSGSDVEVVAVDGHEHHSWGFTTSGVYRLTFRVSATLTGQSQPVVGAEHTFLFHLLPLKPFEFWQASHWPCECHSNIIAAAANPDSDRGVNAIEYALGSVPTNSASFFPPVPLVVQHEGQTFGALGYTRAKAASDVVVQVFGADTVHAIHWQLLTNIHGLADEGPLERVVVRDQVPLAGGKQRFYQLRVSLP